MFSNRRGGGPVIGGEPTVERRSRDVLSVSRINNFILDHKRTLEVEPVFQDQKAAVFVFGQTHNRNQNLSQGS